MLFVDGNCKKVNGKTCYDNATQCICLLSAYLKKIEITLVVVVHDDIHFQRKTCVKDRPPQTGFKIPKNCFRDVLIRHHHSINANVKNCCLPVVYEEDQQFLISGLCHVLRFLVKHANEFLQLLGHKKFCLKATSEVSSRTNLCEVIGPAVIDCWNDDVTTTTFAVPDAMMQVEKLLNEPVSIHNRDKRQRVVLKKLTKTTMTQIPDKSEPEKKLAKLYRTNLNSKLAVRTNDLPPLEHVFAEGVELTLTDLALLPMVHAIFNAFSTNQIGIQQNLSSTWLWYNRVWNVDEVLCAANLAGATIVTGDQIGADFLNICMPSGNCEILRLGDTSSKNPNKIKRKELEKTIRRDLPAVLDKISVLEYVQIQQFKTELISLNWKSYPIEVHPVEGELSSKRARRKCQQIENIFYSVKSMCVDGNTIVDFCAGGGHVGIVIAYLLPQCHIVIIDNKEESLDRARKRIDALRLKNITVYQCNLQNFGGSFDVGVALHACGVATDLVLHKCLNAEASFAISPCCYGKIQKTDGISYPQSKLYQEGKIDYDSLILLGHAADQTSWDFEGEKPKQGKRCMELVDTDRASYAREFGYETHLYTMQPRDCSPKNNLIVGLSSRLKKSSS